MKKLVKNLIIVVLGIVGIVLCGCLLSGLVNWLIADTGRFILGLLISGYVLYRIGKKEFDR